MPLSLARIRAARRLLAGVAHHTPLVHSTTFSRMAGAQVYLKCENLQRSGSFKIRGAYVRVASLEAAQGVVAAPAGNHAQGVALAAARAGVPATVVMPRHAAIAKVMATEGYGARVILSGETYDDAQEKAREIQRATGAVLVPAFDDPWVMAGQGTVGLEILQDLPDCQVLVVPVGGGGLIAGLAVAVRAVRPRIRIAGVQAAGAAAVRVSRQKGRLVTLPAVDTIADGIAVKRPGELTFPLIQRHVDEVVTVAEEEIASTILLRFPPSSWPCVWTGQVGNGCTGHMGNTYGRDGGNTAVMEPGTGGRSGPP